MMDTRIATVESEVWGFLRMVVRAEYWTRGPSRIALYFIDEKFRGSYPVSGITAL
jgi:hypothetical protein